MTDFLIALGAGLGIYFLLRAPGRFKRRFEADAAMRRVTPVIRQGAKERSPWLTGLAAQVEKTRYGRMLAGYAAKAHPHVAFSDVLAIFLSCVLSGLVVGGLLFGGGPLTMLMMAGAPIIADRTALKVAGRRTTRLEQQLPEALHLQASALKAGHTTSRSLRVIASEVRAPLGEEVDRTVREMDLGTSLETALQNLSRRTGSRDIDLWVTALLVHRTTGGNLPMILSGLASRVRDRTHVRAEIRALTAQGRMSGLVVALAPVAFFIILSITSKDQMRVLYTTPLGLFFLVLGVAMEVVGYLWIRMILKIRA
ncbi:MAG TPA: type II secretion system F family protein [Actinomycetota bacterium]|nr:type II secretion system F family protein [Actinomycetota bacterium]